MTFTAAADVTTIADTVVDDNQPFFAPMSSDLVDSLIGQYQSMRKRIEGVAAMIDDEISAAIAYFFDGLSAKRDRYSSMPFVSELFDAKLAIAALNAAYWSKAMSLTDVYDAMPQARREEWSKSIREQTTPDFEETSVRATLADLLASRHKFLAERVDGIFQSLSREHVTNSPSGFNKRMILNYVTDSYSYVNSGRAGIINDLRAVIAKFMGRDEPRWNSSNSILRIARRNHGKWMIVDGGAMRIRVYMKGTAHLEVHPDIAYRLNQILAFLYPAAIPSEFRTKPTKKHKEFQMMGRPLPFAVLSIIDEMRTVRNNQKRMTLGYATADNKAAMSEVIHVMSAIGGVFNSKLREFEFEYPPQEAIQEILTSGCIPDRKSHQFYPTPASVGSLAIEMAEIGDEDTCLEPSAGQGDLAALMPIDRTTCVEISKLHCAVLKARGLNAVEADFIEWAKTAAKVDVVVMNPPFSEGRAQHHVEVAAGLVNKGGRLVAVLPASLKGSDILPGWDVQWSGVFSNEFAGTSVSVVIVRGVKP